MVFGIIVLVFILLVVGLLLIPLEIYIDTNSRQYYVQLKGLVKASIEPDKEEIIKIRLKVPFKNFSFYPLRKLGVPKPKTKRKEKKKTRGFPPKKIIGLLKSFSIKRLKIDLDTGDCITNAKLYPAFVLLDHYVGGFKINFEGRNRVELLLRNRPIRIIRSFINF
ncbi:hypothetical protein [Flagellimonas meishanensis]|uniref:hypothetical protein n=1 Tax=Flagellimonas meishanensis TaxID=2873264 RepID=UPI001CA6EBCB|nr:hypothetical protein [[Muricauda] meishanensis]